MTERALVDASAFWRIESAALPEPRYREIAGRIARGLVLSSTPLVLEASAGRKLPAVDLADLPWVWISERAERRAIELQRQLRASSQQLGVPPMDYLIAAIAEDHGAAILHYDADFERIAKHTDLAVPTEPLAPLGSLP